MKLKNFTIYDGEFISVLGIIVFDFIYHNKLLRTNSELSIINIMIIFSVTNYSLQLCMTQTVNFIKIFFFNQVFFQTISYCQVYADKKNTIFYNNNFICNFTAFLFSGVKNHQHKKCTKLKYLFESTLESLCKVLFTRPCTFFFKFHQVEIIWIGHGNGIFSECTISKSRSHFITPTNLLEKVQRDSRIFIHFHYQNSHFPIRCTVTKMTAQDKGEKKIFSRQS